jgi:hypothetical protein
VEFQSHHLYEGSEPLSFEEVLADNAQEAVRSIKAGWPECRIKNVYMMINDCWEDEDVE